MTKWKVVAMTVLAVLAFFAFWAAISVVMARWHGWS